MRVASLFSGAGGLDCGFIQAGHEIVWANDVFHEACETYKLNIGNHIVEARIEDVDIENIPECDIMVGGFPCQGFSITNLNRRVDDPRNKMYLEYLRLLKNKKPNYFMAENVKGILSIGKGEVFKKIIMDFTNVGYRVKHKVLNAADFGVPQKRERVIIIGTRLDIDQEPLFPNPTHSKNNPTLIPWVSIGSALNSIPDPDKNHNLKNHTYSKQKLTFKNFTGNRRICPNKPAPTVTARGDDKGGVVVLNHPSNLRKMSARELATTQSFPLDYEFIGTQSCVYRQIGNAVPPLLATAIANQFNF